MPSGTESFFMSYLLQLPFLVLGSVVGHNIFVVLLKVGILCKIIFMFIDIAVSFVTYISSNLSSLCNYKISAGLCLKCALCSDFYENITVL